jgi:hypothetical protein
MSLEQRKLVSEPLLDAKESNKEKVKAARLLAKNHSDNLN